MKKLFVLLVLVVAMVAAPLFAEVGAQTWEGDFTFKMGGDFSSMLDSTDNDMDISLEASVGEFTTFDVGIEADPFDQKVDVAGVQEDRDGVLELDYIEMTQDYGAMFGLGFDLAMTAGNWDFGPTEYEDMFDFEFIHPAAQNAIQFAAGANGITATLWFPIKEMADGADQFAGSVVYESDMANVAVNYVRPGVGSSRDLEYMDVTVATLVTDDNSGMLSASAEVMPVEGTTLYASVEADLEFAQNQFGFGAAYTMDALTVEAAFEAWMMAEDTTLGLPEVAIDDTGIVGLGVAYDLSDTLTGKAGFYYSLSESVDYAFDAGLCMDVDTVEYCFGVSYAPESSDGFTVGDTYVAPYSAADFGEDFAVSFQMDVDF